MGIRRCCSAAFAGCLARSFNAFMQGHSEDTLPDETGSKVAVIVAGLVGGYLVHSAIETLYPRPWSNLDSFDLELVAGSDFSSIVFLLWAITAAPAWRRTSLRWVKRLVAVHAVCLLLVDMTRWGRIGWIIYPFFAFTDLIVFLYPGKKAQPETLRFARNATLILSGGHVAVLLLWSLATIPLVMWSATSLAASKPYCIATGQGFNFGAGAKDYRPVTALLDMQGLIMQAPQQHGGTGWWFNTFHAVLVIQGDAGTSWWNWSHLTAGFVSINHPTAFGSLVSPETCHPEFGFLGKLKIF